MIMTGTPCIPWSSMGSCKQLLHEVTKVFAAWLAWAIHCDADVIIHECTVRFEPLILHFFLNPVGGESDWTWVIESIVLSPTDFGIPINRSRRFTVCRKTFLGMKGGLYGITKLFRTVKVTAGVASQIH